MAFRELFSPIVAPPFRVRPVHKHERETQLKPGEIVYFDFSNGEKGHFIDLPQVFPEINIYEL